MTVPFLSICIPTFNRKRELSALFSQLADQVARLEGKVELIVIDNCSSEPVSSYLPASGGKIIRNGCNIGSVGNILRAVEVASGQFVWLVGDDDQIAPGAVQVCLQECERSGSASHIFFSNRFATYPTTAVCEGINNFCAQFSPSRYGGMLWMSSQAINRLHALEVIRYAYAYPGSSPQLALALLSAHRTTVFSSIEVAIHTQADAGSHWNPDSIFSQMNQLLLLPVAERLRRALALALAQFLMPVDAHFFDVLTSYYNNAPDASERTQIFLNRFRMIATASNDEALMSKTAKCEKILRNPNLRAELYRQFKFGAETKPRIISGLQTNYIP